MNLAWFGNNEIGIFDEFGMVSFWWIWHGWEYNFWNRCLLV